MMPNRKKFLKIQINIISLKQNAMQKTNINGHYR